MRPTPSHARGGQRGHVALAVLLAAVALGVQAKEVMLRAEGVADSLDEHQARFVRNFEEDLGELERDE